jgi:hypothetical protein
MSGRKYSRIELVNRIRAAIQLHAEAREALSAASAQLEALARESGGASTYEKFRVEAAGQLASLRAEFEALGQRISAAEGTDPDDLDEIDAIRARIAAASTATSKTWSDLRTANERLSHRLELVGLRDRVAAGRTEFACWAPNLLADLESHLTATIQSLEGSATAAGIDIASILGDARDRYAALCESCRQNREAAEDRRFVADAVEKVCLDLAFSVRREPQQSPLEDLLLVVDTHAYGSVRFRLELEGNIRSESELAEPACGLNFPLIEKRLRAYGVLSAFRYEADQRPVRIKDDSARPLIVDTLGGSLGRSKG